MNIHICRKKHTVLTQALSDVVSIAHSDYELPSGN